VLLNINPLLTGELLKRLDEMGHSDYVLIADGNFPAHRLDPHALEYPGTTVPQVAAAVCEVLPLDPDLAPVLMDSGPAPAPTGELRVWANVILYKGLVTA
jgi:L-fucose mutarotase